MRANKPQSAVPSNRNRGLMGGPQNDNFMGKPRSTATNIQAIMKKFKTDNAVPQSKKKEREVTHMQRNTLLEPNNFIPQWEAGGEEKKEVSATLKALRQKYDKTHKKFLQKQQELKDLQHQYEKAGEEEMYLKEDKDNKESLKSETQENQENLVTEHNYEKLTQQQYEHMLDRLKKDLISSQLKSQELKDSLKQKNDLVVEQSEYQRKAKQDRIQAKMKLEQVIMQIDQDQMERRERISALNKSLTNKSEALQRRITRVRHQQEIAEMAANQNKDQNEIEMQYKFLVHCLFTKFLTRKMKNEMKNHAQIEQAFQNIRTATGLSDVNEIVQNFMTREQTYSHLLMQVSDNERKIDKLRLDHEQQAQRLHELQMEDEEDEGATKKTSNRNDGTNHGFNDEEIDELDAKIKIFSKEKEQADELNKKVNLVNDQVHDWCSKVIQKIDQQFDENIAVHENSKTMNFLFEQICQAVCKQLEKIIMEEDDEDRGYITQKDFMNDFMTEDFLNKNIRVRPLSGVSRGDDGKTNDVHNKSLNNDQFGNNDVDEKFNMMQEIEMDDHRKEAKSQRLKALQKKALEDEKAAKKQRR